MTGPSLSETTHSYFPPDILLLYGFPDLPRASALLVTTDCIVSMSSCEEEQQQQLHHIRRCTPHPRRAVFQARLLDNSTRCQHRRIRFRKALGEMFPTPSFWHRHYSDCGDIERGQSAQGGVIYIYTPSYTKQIETLYPYEKTSIEQHLAYCPRALR